MSDRMSNVEIEDVLSSIRRLVSEDLRGAPAAEPVRPPVPRLVLTPALRVDTPVAPEPQAEPEVVTPVGREALVARLAELEAILDAQDQSFEDEAGESLDMPVAVARLAEAADAPFIAEAPFIDDSDEGTEPAIEPAPEVEEAFAWTEPVEPVGEDEVLPATSEEPFAGLDAATLRELIRDVLREELQGEIGERVTRNLRKMIRTEVSRALTARGVV